jgi:ribosomal protein L11 methyltransferase
MEDEQVQNWKITVFGTREVIQAALIAHEDAFDWDEELVIAGCEVAKDQPEDWKLEVYLPREPWEEDCVAVEKLFSADLADEELPELIIEQLPDIDWITESQQGLEPIFADRFCVHTPEREPSPDHINFVIPASRAFGTGHHETTAGCLAMLSQMKREGTIARNVADIGTGTGLLAFAALRLWPRAFATASDIDAACVGVVDYNVQENGFTLGAKAGELAMVVADGMDDPVLKARGPYDLLIANILAGPLIELAPDFAKALVPGGNLLLAGLLATQEAQVRAACRRAGLRLARREQRGDWSILWLRKRRYGGIRATRPGQLPEWSRKW